MADRSNARLNEAIEQHIAQWDGTVHGFCIKNMWETSRTMRMTENISVKMRKTY